MKPRISFIYAALVAATVPAIAGGMVLPIRGIRTLERAGAFVAGADDADALWLDPAGIAHVSGSGTRQLLFDVGYVYQPVTYTPTDAAGNQLAPLENLQPGNTPIPTLAAAYALDDRFTVAGGLTAPYAGMHRYDPAGAQRYASVDMTGSSFYTVALGAAYRVSDSLRVGAMIQDTIAKVDAKVTAYMCTGAGCDPNDRSYDSLLTLEQTDYVAPSGALGVQWDVHRLATLACRSRRRRAWRARASSASSRRRTCSSRARSSAATRRRSASRCRRSCARASSCIRSRSCASRRRCRSNSGRAR